jgi:hypothetical protein
MSSTAATIPARAASSTPESLLAEALARLPMREQFGLYRDAALDHPVRRPFLFLEPGAADDTAAPPLAPWLAAHQEALTLHLLRYDALLPVEIAMLREHDLIGPPPPLVPIEVTMAFGPEDAEAPGLALDQAAVALAVLQMFEATYSEAFAWLGASPTRPTVRLGHGSLQAVLQNSAGALGLAIMLDALSGGALLPLTAPIYAKVAIGAGLMLPPMLSGTVQTAKGIVETIKIAREAKEIEARQQETLGRARKVAAEAEEIERSLQSKLEVLQTTKAKLEAEREETAARGAKAQAEAEATRAKLGTEIQLARKQLAKLEAEAAEIATRTAALQTGATGGGTGVAAGPAAMTADEAAAISAPARLLNVNDLRAIAQRFQTEPTVVAYAVNVGAAALATSETLGVRLSAKARPGAPRRERGGRH